MTVVVLGASGGTGRQLVAEALGRGLEVRAVVRNPDAAGFAHHVGLAVVRADVHDAARIAEVIDAADTVVSGLGVATRSEAGTLSAGAAAVVGAHPSRVVWLGAMGTGPSSAAVSRPVGWLMRTAFGAEYDDKVRADSTVLAAGGVVVHSGVLSDKPDEARVRLERIALMPKQFFPLGAPRASIARLMLDLATADDWKGGLVAVRRGSLN